MSQRKAATRTITTRYKRSSRGAKKIILDELCAITGWHRDHARKALRDALVFRKVKHRPPRPVLYGDAVIEALRFCWVVQRTPCGRLLAAALVDLVPRLRAFDELDIDDATAAKLLTIAPATIDRRLKAQRGKLDPRGRSHTKPGSLLKDSIPMRTWADWDDARPGFLEIDLVGHEGGNNIGIDSDNGSEFINWELFRWCEQEKLTFTRLRSGNKNDGAHVEQKNWHIIRQVVSYHRYDSAGELELLNKIWQQQRLLTNHFAPQQKLISKERNGAKISKRYDKPATLYQRVLTD